MSIPQGSEDNPILIGVVGVTGSGKSDFIRRLTRNEDVRVGDGTESQTEIVEQYPLEHNGRKYVLIDSPGFNDSKLDDREVFTRLADWLVATYRAGQLLNGLIYLVSILDNRQKGSEIRNLRMFKTLCGQHCFKNIILGLTFCDVETEENIQRRKKELIENPLWWGDMVARGSVVREIPFKPEEPKACLGILDHFAPQEKMTLQLQSEVVDQGKAIDSTEAASTVLYYKELVMIREQEAKDIKEVERSFELRKAKAEADIRERKAKLLLEHEQGSRRLEEQEAALFLRLQRKEEERRKERARLDEIKRKDEEKRGKELHDLEEQMRQAKLAEVRLKSRQQEARKLKQHALKLRAFQSSQTSCMNALNRWGENKGVTHANTIGHDMLGNFCNTCLIPSFPRPGQVYTCEKCYTGQNNPLRGLEGGEKTLMICASCRAEGHSCLDSSHTLTPEPIPVKASLSRCSRTGSEGEILCNKCTRRVQESHYLHCCECDADNFDLCMSCWGKGSSCKSLSHTLHVLSWCPPHFRR